MSHIELRRGEVDFLDRLPHGGLPQPTCCRHVGLEKEGLVWKAWFWEEGLVRKEGLKGLEDREVRVCVCGFVLRDGCL